MSKELADALKVIERELGVRLKLRKLSELKTDPKNTRVHNDRNRGLIAESMKEVKAGRSVVIDANDVTRAGNATVTVAPDAGITEGIQVETRGDRLLIHKRGDLKDEKAAARLSMMDNASTDASSWDVEQIVALVQEDADILTGIFDEDDDVLHKVRRALAESTATKAEEDEIVIPPPGKAITKRGDVWVCGDHRIMCGDATSGDDLDTLLDGAKIHMVYTDPPYGIDVVAVSGKVGGGGGYSPRGQVGGGGAFGGKKNEIRGASRIEATQYAPIIGDDTTDTAIKSFKLCASRKFKTMIWWGGNHYASALPDSKCWIVWDKMNGENNFADAELAWTNMDRAVRMFRHQWNGLIKASERGEKRVHPTQKPIALAAWCFEKFGVGGDHVLDLFGGSGSTLLACESTQRKAFVMELSPPYCDVMVARWEHSTGRKATRITGR